MKTHKFRSEIVINSNQPKFKKNSFIFQDVSFGSRLTIKFGIFQTKHYSDPGNNAELVKDSQLSGSASIVFTK